MHSDSTFDAEGYRHGIIKAGGVRDKQPNRPTNVNFISVNSRYSTMFFSTPFLLSAAGLFVHGALGVPSPLPADVDVGAGATANYMPVLNAATAVVGHIKTMKSTIAAVQAKNTNNRALNITLTRMELVSNCVVPSTSSGGNLLGGLLGGCALAGACNLGGLSQLLGVLTNPNLLNSLLGGADLTNLLNGLLGGLLGGSSILVGPVANLLDCLDLLNTGCGCGASLDPLLASLITATNGLLASLLTLGSVGQNCACGSNQALRAGLNSLVAGGV
ncbi:hypothetical protein C8R44DRAFT_889324 [Mycena epipterygia]|nr:hypothetical protein C8R44DRAFT_889324 [Mycena epipterygia]